MAIVQLTARKGREADLVASLARVTGLSLPQAGHTSQARDLAAVAFGPGTWLVMEPWRAQPELAQILRTACGNAAAVVDQTGGKTVLQIAGKHARRVLAKGCRIDLHPRVFGPDRVAVTSVAHINMAVVQRDDAPTFDLIMGSTFAATFLEWLEMSAAEFGYVLGG